MQRSVSGAGHDMDMLITRCTLPFLFCLYFCFSASCRSLFSLSVCLLSYMLFLSPHSLFTFPFLFLSYINVNSCIGEPPVLDSKSSWEVPVRSLSLSFPTFSYFPFPPKPFSAFPIRPWLWRLFSSLGWMTRPAKTAPTLPFKSTATAYSHHTCCSTTSTS